MDGARNNNYSGRGRGRDQGGRGRGGRGWEGSNRGPQNQRPARPPVNQPQYEPARGFTPPPQHQIAGARAPNSTGRAWGPPPGTQPPPPSQAALGYRPPRAATPQPSQTAGAGPPPGSQPPPPSQPAWGYRSPQAATPQPSQTAGAGPSSGRGTGRAWGPPSSHPLGQPRLPSPSPSPPPPQPTAAVVPTPKLLPSQSNEGQIEVIKRPDLGGKLAVRSINLLVNHFQVSFKTDATIFHYDVEVKPVATNGSKPTTKSLRKSDLHFIRDSAFAGPNLLKAVYDGEKNIFSTIELDDTKVYKINVSEGEDVRSGSYTLRIKLVSKLELFKLDDYMRGNCSTIPRNILQGLDLVMKDNPMRKTIPFGNRTFFMKKSIELGLGLAAHNGFQPSLKPTKQGLVLCLDYSVLAMRKPVPVIDYLKENVYGFRGVGDVLRLRREVTEALRGLKVRVTHRRTNQKYTIIGLTDKVARKYDFTMVDDEGKNPKKIMLVDYFRNKWGKAIRDLDVPCLDVGKPKKPNVVPMEFCVLVEGQRYPKEELPKDTAAYLKSLTLVKAWERQKTISDMVRADDGPYGEAARNFGIGLDVNMTKVAGRVIGAPELKVGGTRPVRVDDNKCQWNLLGKTFVDAKSADRWALLDFTEGDRNRLDVDRFIDNLRGRSKSLGMRMAPPTVVWFPRMIELSSTDRIEKLLQEAMNESSRISKGKLQLIVCAMPKRDPGYKSIKWVSETKIGVVTQCLLSQSFNKGQDQYLANLCLKINVKLGGTNFEVSGKLMQFNPADHVMFIGADVNHPAPMNKECPSIAAVVSTVNWPAANRYAARVSPQTHRCETIKNFGEMCSHLVAAYARINKVRPKRIVLFRDGVSEGQFEMVLSQELLDLKKTIYTDDYQPPITVIVAQKRHLTRLFPANRSDGGQTGNVPPGTVVDTTIVHPHNFDFYLNSHYGGMGTSKPTHYYVLWDENGFTSDHLQKLIYDMCFTFVRCTKPVSLVPPVYYADLVAYRGRMFQEVAMETGASSSSATSFDPSFYSLHPDLENMMFFV